MTAFRWRIELLGSLCLRREDQIVETFPPSKVGGLLAYLACRSQRTHTRQELAEFFWPETDNGIGRTRLRQHLTALRRQLEPEGVPPGSVLRANRDEIVLEPAAFTTDAADFENTLRRVEQTKDADERFALLDRAAGFYRGELLSGYHKYWIVGERERLKGRAATALRELASACENAQDTARSIDYLQRLVVVDPLCEENHVALMRLLMATHQPDAARRQYKTLERLLKTGLDAVPAQETRALLVPGTKERTNFFPVLEGAISVEGAASNAPASPGVLADAIPTEDLDHRIPVGDLLPAVAVVPESSMLEPSAAPPLSPAQDAQFSSPSPAIPLPAPVGRGCFRPQPAAAAPQPDRTAAVPDIRQQPRA